MHHTWLLLIYTVPAEPSRKRAFIWREVKKAGAVYLRDGVCALPEQPETARSLRTIAAKVQEFEGEATLVQGARLDPARADWLVSRSRASRAEEYADVAREAERLLEHVARETEHREFTFAELEELEADLGKLKRWAAQVRERDHFGQGADQRLQTLLDRCDQALGAFLDETASRDADTSAQPGRDPAATARSRPPRAAPGPPPAPAPTRACSHLPRPPAWRNPTGTGSSPADT